MTERTGNSTVAQILVLLLHSVILWLLIPAGFLAWLISIPFTLHRPIKLGAFLAWLAYNEIAFQKRILLRPWFGAPLKWLSPRAMRGLTFRISAREMY